MFLLLRMFHHVPTWSYGEVSELITDYMNMKGRLVYLPTPDVLR